MGDAATRPGRHGSASGEATARLREWMETYLYPLGHSRQLGDSQRLSFDEQRERREEERRQAAATLEELREHVLPALKDAGLASDQSFRARWVDLTERVCIILKSIADRDANLSHPSHFKQLRRAWLRLDAYLKSQEDTADSSSSSGVERTKRGPQPIRSERAIAEFKRRESMRRTRPVLRHEARDIYKVLAGRMNEEEVPAPATIERAIRPLHQAWRQSGSSGR